MRHFQKTTLSSGLRILTERHEEVRSATIGIWIEGGSVYERERERGLAHLLEHLVFKGTTRRSMSQIAKDMDEIGGHMNAFTEREFVCYHVKVLAEHTPQALELLTDFVARPLLRNEDLELERGVVLEEIRSVEDDPEELVEDVFTETIWPRSRWGHAILGTEKSVSRLSAADLRAFMDTHYTPKNIVVAAVGLVDHEDICRRAEALLAELAAAPRGASHRVPVAPPITSHEVRIAKDTEQVHLICGTRGYSYHDDARYAAGLLDAVLTGGYSSRLFQEIREKRGLCYNIGPMSASYRNAGFWAVETSVAPENARETVKLLGRELRKVRERGITKAELARAQRMTKINVLLSEESSSAQMTRIARNELCYRRQRSIDEILDNVAGVGLEDVHQAARTMFDAASFNLAAIGPAPDKLHIDL